MIDKDKFNEIFISAAYKHRSMREKAKTHYQEQADICVEEMLIDSFRATEQHPCAVNVDILVAGLEDNAGVIASANVVKSFKAWLFEEIQRVGDYD